MLAGRKIMVTGASGFLGSNLCLRLLKSGAEVHGVSRTARSIESGHLRWWQADLTDIAAVRRLIRKTKPDVIFHLSGLATAASHLELVLPTSHSLLLSTLNIMVATAEIGCHRLVLAGSLTEPKPGDIDPAPGSPYAAAKWATTAYGRMFSRLYNLPVVIIRPFMTFGPRQDRRKLVPHVTLSLLRGQAPKLSNGLWKVDWIYVDDLIDGMIAAAEAPNVHGCTIDLGSGVLVSVRKMVESIVTLTDARIDPLFGALPDRQFEHERVADLSNAYSKLGWRPRVSLMDGLKKTVDWYRQKLSETIALAFFLGNLIEAL